MTEERAIASSGVYNRAWVRLVATGRVVCLPAHLRRTCTIAVVVGLWLTTVNQWDVLLARGVDVGTAIKVALNFMTPFIVANFGLLARREISWQVRKAPPSS